MRATQVVRGRTIKTVTVVDVPPLIDQDVLGIKVLSVALIAASESRSSIWGYHIEYIDNTARVTLHTD